MSHIQIIGHSQNPPPATVRTAPGSEKIPGGGDAMTAAALASLVDRLGSSPAKNENTAFSTQPDPQLQEAMAKINQSANFRVEMETAKGTGLPVITIRDRATGEIIRQIPQKLFVAAAQQIDSNRGFLFEKVA